MDKQNNHRISWTTIYSLGLLPLIMVWGLTILITNECIVSIASILIGALWIELSPRLINYPQGCGIIGWATGWGLFFSGVGKIILLLLNVQHIPIVLFLAPMITLLLFLFYNNIMTPSFCHQCIAQRGGAQERKLLGDFSRYETRLIVRQILNGGLLVILLTWGLFVYGIDPDSRIGCYFYIYVPLGLSVAIILFETIRRLLINAITTPQEKETDDSLSPHKQKILCYTSIRVVVICQGEIYLTQAKEQSPNRSKDEIEFDTPIQHLQEYNNTLEQEKQVVLQTIRQYLETDNLDLRHFSSVTTPASTYLRRLGQYLLFLPAEEKSKLNLNNGKWYPLEELNQLYRNNNLYPVLKEFYARLHTIVSTARTYHRNGERRFAIKGYTPSFSLLDIEKLDIEFDDPIWLYVNRHNEDKFLYRLQKKFLRRKKISS